ncbi:MAG: TIGR04282 family arsenosugar biosynthesis glycosyltransferase [Halioglobus sp.]
MADEALVGAKTLLIQFAKEPVAGKVKTRMLQALTPQEAEQLHTDLVRWVFRTLLHSDLGPIQLAVSGDTRHPLFEECLLLGAMACVEQRGVNLGERMYHALFEGLKQYEKVVLVGSDCPEMDAGYIAQAIGELDEVPIVLGAAQDGGYVLIGATKITQNVFTNVSWGSGEVLAATIANLSAAQIPFAILDTLQDIDRPEDLPSWEALATGRIGKQH